VVEIGGRYVREGNEAMSLIERQGDSLLSNRAPRVRVKLGYWVSLIVAGFPRWNLAAWGHILGGWRERITSPC
jgi:hypothetical protein